ncbi:MAG: ABC transporter ATP-binding protein [Desulfobacterales bacterium]|uniref:ABC transporter ATP-binding protein n=1 Tax=Candidatus Desulfatibia vada TaxID=2841696 RepID=A0A8J6TQP3_9BACT|nr:ABC transporter ATP-binding protein [Candidatus Desulfatibia vada]
MEKLFEIDQISFGYKLKRVINSLSLTLEAGVFYGIIGPNGCGKTTLLDLMINHIQPTAGRIRYKGKTLAGYSKKSLSREIALVPQNFYINFPFTAKEVVMMGRYPHIKRFAAPSTRDIRFVQDIMVKTDTLEFENRFITQLSSGERQRVVFARALAQDSPVLVLDEATSNLDINHAIGMLKLAAQGVANETKTVIAVMQDINLAAAFCDHLIFVQHGNVVANGPIDKILNSETLRDVFQVDSKIYFEPYSDSMQVVFKK